LPALSLVHTILPIVFCNTTTVGAEVLLCVKKSNYGEDIGCCIEKLYLASRLINRLECFCFETPVFADAVSAEFTYTLNNNDYLSDTILQLIVDGVQVGTLTTDAEYKPGAWSTLLDAANIDYVLVDNGSDSTFTLTMPCNITEVTALITKDRVTNSFALTNSVAGVCEVSTPPCYNCIENSDLPKMYEVLHKLLQ